MRRAAAKRNVERIILAVGIELEPFLSNGTTRAASKESPTAEKQRSEDGPGINGATADREGRCLLLMLTADADDVDPGSSGSWSFGRLKRDFDCRFVLWPAPQAAGGPQKTV